jgi:hypothetical protein
LQEKASFQQARKNNPAIGSWDLANSWKVSFAESQAINVRTNLALRELAETRANRIKNLQEKRNLKAQIKQERAN